MWKVSVCVCESARVCVVDMNLCVCVRCVRMYVPSTVWERAELFICVFFFVYAHCVCVSLRVSSSVYLRI